MKRARKLELECRFSSLKENFLLCPITLHPSAENIKTFECVSCLEYKIHCYNCIVLFSDKTFQINANECELKEFGCGFKEID